MKFLLDENVSRKLVPSISSLGCDVSSIRKQGMLGIKNGELSHWIKENDWVLITHDKDFKSYCVKYELRVILIDVHPATFTYVLPAVKHLFEHCIDELSDNFIILLRSGNYSLVDYTQ